jgi:hypothetical protein
VHGRAGMRLRGPRADLVRYSAVSGAAALVCAVMNILEATGGGIVAAAVGNATNVFAPAMLWAMARRLNARREIGVISAGAASLLLLGVSFVLSPADGILVKTAAIVAFSVLLAVEVRRGPVRTTTGSMTMAVSIAAFAAYNLWRIVVALTGGMDSLLWQSAASAEITSIVSAAATLLMSISLVQMGRGIDARPEPGTRAYEQSVLRERARDLLAEHPELVGLTLEIPELNLVRAAHGPERADALVDTLLAATREALPRAVAGTTDRTRVVALLPADIEWAGLARSVRDGFARHAPGAGYADTPDLRITHRGVGDASALDAFLDPRLSRRRGGTAQP